LREQSFSINGKKEIFADSILYKEKFEIFFGSSIDEILTRSFQASCTIKGSSFTHFFDFKIFKEVELIN